MYLYNTSPLKKELDVVSQRETIPSLIHLFIKCLLKARYGTEYWEWSDKEMLSGRGRASILASHPRRAAATMEACTYKRKSFMQTFHVRVCVLSREGFH